MLSFHLAHNWKLSSAVVRLDAECTRPHWQVSLMLVLQSVITVTERCAPCNSVEPGVCGDGFS